MGHTVRVRLGGDTTPSWFDVTAQVPVWDIDGMTPLIHAGNSLDGSSGELLVIDDPNVIPAAAGTANLAAHTEVQWYDDGPGFDCWLSVGRIATKKSERRDHPWGDSRTWTVNFDDLQQEMIGIGPGTAGWVRSAESDIARVEAAIAAFANGTASTEWDADPAASNARASTTIQTHLVNSSAGTVTMPANTYEPGDLLDIIEDCATSAGKIGRVVIHHQSGASHKCLLYIDEEDHSTYPSCIRISDDPANHDFTAACGVGSAAYNLDFEELDSMGNYDPVAVYPSGTGSWPRDPLYWSDTNPAGHGGGKCVVWGGIFSTESSNSPLLPASPGVTYNYHLWARWEGYGITPVSDMLRVVFRDVDDIIVGTTSITGSGDVPDAWTEYQVDAVAPADTAYMYLECHDGFGPNGYTAAYDDVTVTGGAGDGPCFPPKQDDLSTEEEGQHLAHRVISIWSGGTVVSSAGTAQVNSYDAWTRVYHDSTSVNATQAQARSDAILTDWLYEHVTHTVSVRLAADQLDYVTAGQSIPIKSAAVMGGQYLDTFQTRRVAALQWEPINPSADDDDSKRYYWAHMQLDRPLRTSGTGTGSGNRALTAAESTDSSLTTHAANPEAHHALLVVQEDDASPSVDPTSTLEFDASDFSVTDSGGGTATVAYIGSGGGGLVIEEVDGTPSGTVTVLVLPNSTLGLSGGTATYTPAATSGLVIEELDGSPTGTATKLVLPNSTLSYSGGTATYTASSGAVTREYLGYNTVGASSESTNTNRVYLKKISVTNACDLLSVQVYVNGQSGSNITGIGAGLWSDSSGSPLTLLAKFLPENHFEVLFQGASTGADRWLAMPLNYELAASTDYWVGFIAADPDFSFRKDGSGGDRYFTAGGLWLTDAGYTTVTTTTDKYSIRARVIR